MSYLSTLPVKHGAARATSWAMAFVLAVSLCIVASVPFTTNLASADPNVTVQPIFPYNGETVDGQITLRSTVNGMSPDGYMMFWAVDHGQWNLMQQDSGNPAVATADINVSGWNWESSNNYTLQFIALMKNNWQPIETDITIHIGTPPVQNAALAPQAAAVAQPLFVDPENNTNQEAIAWGASNPEDATRMNYLASQPIAAWFGDWNGSDIQGAVNDYVSRAQTAQQLPMLVAYNIPNRDCGGDSAGGATSPQAYTDWITSFANGIGRRNAIVILEPDALAGMDCLSAFGQSSRLMLLNQAVNILKTTTNAKVYIDAGNPSWQSAATMAARLKLAGIDQADGFSLNVSNFFTTSANITYGTAISKLVGGKHFVIDTSRNGNGPTSDDQWCNPSGRAVGQAPTLETGNNLVDAFLWVKGPGGSDGTCGANIDGTSAPAAGVWWPQYADQLLENADIY